MARKFVASAATIVNSLNSQFNQKRPHRTHRAKWPLTYAHNESIKKDKTNMQTATLFSELFHYSTCRIYSIITKQTPAEAELVILNVQGIAISV